MHPEAAPALGNPDEGPHKAVEFGAHGRELVDHNDESGQRSAGRSTAAVVVDVVGSGFSKKSLPVAKFSFERLERPLGEMVVKIGDEACDMWKLCASVKRRPALVVDQHKDQFVGAVVRRKAQDQAAEKL